MSKVYNWWLDQICLNCNDKNEYCHCADDYPTDPVGEFEND